LTTEKKGGRSPRAWSLGGSVRGSFPLETKGGHTKNDFKIQLTSLGGKNSRTRRESYTPVPGFN